MKFIFFSIVFIPLCSKVVESHKNGKLFQTEIMNLDNVNLPSARILTSPTSIVNLGLEQNPHGPVHRRKRGIIWNKIKKVKKGIWSAKKKLWRIKEKAVEIVIGKDHATPKPHYQSTGGSWGWYQKQVPKRQSSSLPQLSGQSGPPYDSASNFKGVLFPISAGSGWSNIWPNNKVGSSTKLTYEDLLAIYRLPLNLDAFHKLKKIGITSRL